VVNDPTPPPGAGDRPRILVLRFHSLGDCVLTTGVMRALAATARVTVATEERFRPVFAGLPWIDRVRAREELERAKGASTGVAASGGPSEAGAPAATTGWSSEAGASALYDRVIDLQGTPHTRWLSRSLGHESATVRTCATARRWLVLWGDRVPRPRVPHAVARYAEAAGMGGPDAGGRDAMTLCRPEARPTEEEETAARRLAPEAFVSPAGTALAIVTGASRRTKEYPPEGFAEVARLVRGAGFEVWWIEPPGAEADRPDGRSTTSHGLGWLGQGPGPAHPGAMPLLRLPLGPLKAVLARARAVAASDSGPMHLAAALGVPVLGIFGSTVAGFGFAPLGPRARLLEVKDLACRPCGVHGRDRCWLGHWRCLRDLRPAQVAEALLALAGKQPVMKEEDEHVGA
jgi:ADP-heptose:LPS heptosyltransferase